MLEVSTVPVPCKGHELAEGDSRETEKQVQAAQLATALSP